MPRKARRYSTSCFKHIIVQGINKEYIFNKKEYIERYKEIIIEKLKNSDIRMLGYCIMNNHAHFLIHSEKCEDLSKYMQKLNTTYSQFYNKINNRVGYVFRDRYYSQDILSQKQLYNCLIYIHNNPVKAGMTKTMQQYRYSSYNEFLEKQEIITTEAIKLLFNTTQISKKEFYRIHNFYSENEDEFIEVKEKKILDFIKEFQKQYEVRIEDIRNNKGILKKLIIDARRKTNVTIVELANILNISKSTVGKYAKK